jgi:hypothetical protein
MVLAACSAGTTSATSQSVNLESSPLRITETMDPPLPEPQTPEPVAQAPVAYQSWASLDASANCVTCKADSYSPMTKRDEALVAAGLGTIMARLRDCMKRVGAERVKPALHLRYDDDGALRTFRVDVGGYEDLECVREAQRDPPRTRASRGTTLKCDDHCN